MEPLRIQILVFLVILSASLTVLALEKEEFVIDRDKIIAENLKDELPGQMKEARKLPQSMPADVPTNTRTLDNRLESDSKHSVNSNHISHSSPYGPFSAAQVLLPEEIQCDACKSEFRSSHQCTPHNRQEFECDSRFSAHFVPCREGWLNFGQKCYKLFLHRRSWNEASQNCSREEGHLATVSSNDLQQFLQIFMVLRERVSAHIGASDLEREGNFQWQDGAPFIYTNWNNNNQPDNRWNIEHCVEMRFTERPRASPSDLGFWNDLDCRSWLPYICQVDNFKDVERMSPDPRYCPLNEGGGFKYRDSCLHVVRSKRTWGEAQRHCEENYNGNLVTILDSEDETFLDYILPYCNEDFWIGITKQDKAVQRWTSGWPVAYNRLEVDLRRSPWGTCVRRSNDMSWSAADCSCEFPFVCETRRSPAPVLRRAPRGWRCPNGADWVDLEGEFCYIFGTNLYLTWHEANNECQRNGGTLACMNSRDEQLILQNFLLQYNRINIGVRRSSANKNVFECVDGSRVEYTNWASGEPNNLEEECVEMRSYSEYTYTWNDIRCNDRRASAYICSARKVPPNKK